MRTAGSVAVVTGGASGLGLATVREPHSQGAAVVVLDLPSSQGRTVADELGERAAFVAGDATSEARSARRWICWGVMVLVSSMMVGRSPPAQNAPSPGHHDDTAAPFPGLAQCVGEEVRLGGPQRVAFGGPRHGHHGRGTDVVDMHRHPATSPPMEHN
jgi:NAD(P)-dependent dehydrogenase (short-subunit alcohol dehydrogenase family)